MTAEWAASYAEAGVRVFPIWPGKKNPIYRHWPQDATTDPKLIRQYWPEGTDRNIAAVCGERFDAWDIEVQHLAKLTDWMFEQGHVWPEGPMARTGRGGLHILTEPTGVNGTRYLYLEGEHIGELKSTGGYILVAPSVTDNQYEWLTAGSGLPVFPAPSWMRGLLDRPQGGTRRFTSRIKSVEEGVRRLAALQEAVKEAGEGRRNNYLYWAMRRALEEGLIPRVAASGLLDAAVEAGLEEDEAQKTIRSAYEAEGMEA